MDWHWSTGIKWSFLFSSFNVRRWWSSPLWPSNWWMQEKAIRQYWILVRRNEEALRQCSALVDRKMGISSGKRWRTKEKVSVLLESELSSSIPVPSSNPRTFRKYNQSCIVRQCTVIRRFYRVYLPRWKRRRIEVNRESWFDSRRSQSQNRQASCVLHCCDSDG